MRRFRKLNAQRQTDPPPAPAVRPPARSSLRPGGGGLFKASRPTRAGKRGSGESWKRGGDGVRAVVLVHLIVVAPSPSSSHLLSRPVVARLVVSSVIRSVCRFHLLVAIRFVVVPPLVSFRLSFRFPSRRRFYLVGVVSSHLLSRPVVSRRGSYCRLISRIFAACAVSLARRSSSRFLVSFIAPSSFRSSSCSSFRRFVVVPLSVPLSSRSIPSARSFSPFLDTVGRGVFSHSMANG